MAGHQNAYLRMAGVPPGQQASPPPTVLDLHGGQAPRTLVQVPLTAPQVPVTTLQVPVTTPPEGFVPLPRPGIFPGGGAGPADRDRQQALRPQERRQQQPVKPVAAQVAEQAMLDPAIREAMRQQAVQLGGHALAAGKYYGHQGLVVFQSYIQQGPRGISILCFVGGVATSVVGLMNVCNLFGSLEDPVHYVISAYMFIFGIVTAVIEADPDGIGTLVPPIDSLAGPVTQAQAWLHDQCKLLTQLRGRGFFYLYQGTIMVTQCVLCLRFLAGLFNALMGVICVLTSFGIRPDVEYMAVGLLGPQRSASSDASSGSDPGGRTQFVKAEAAWAQSKEQLSGKACRELWALHKQATEGDCRVPKPTGVFNGGEKEQWRLWTSLQGIQAEEARALFVERLQREEISF